jgi:hypothetical protein
MGVGVAVSISISVEVGSGVGLAITPAEGGLVGVRFSLGVGGLLAGMAVEVEVGVGGIAGAFAAMAITISRSCAACSYCDSLT